METENGNAKTIGMRRDFWLHRMKPKRHSAFFGTPHLRLEDNFGQESDG